MKTRQYCKIRKWLVVHAFVTSCVDYCNTLLAGAPKVTTDKLQRVLNAAARVLIGTHKFWSITVYRSPTWRHGSTSVQPVNVFWSYRVTVSARTAAGLLPSLARRPGTLSRIISGIRTLLWTTSSACWKRFCSQRISAISALDVTRRCALQIYILLTYFTYWLVLYRLHSKLQLDWYKLICETTNPFANGEVQLHSVAAELAGEHIYRVPSHIDVSTLQPSTPRSPSLCFWSSSLCRQHIQYTNLTILKWWPDASTVTSATDWWEGLITKITHQQCHVSSRMLKPCSLARLLSLSLSLPLSPSVYWSKGWWKQWWQLEL